MSRVVLITGASSGFGQVTAGHLAQKGFTVFGTSRRAGSETSKEAYTMLNMDVRDADSVNAAVQHVLDREGTIDVLVNNAGISVMGPLEASPMADVADIFDTNVYGPLRVCQAVLPAMRKQQSGVIINISSIGGLIGLPYRGLYSATKFALEGLTEALSMEMAPFGVKACVVEPGDFETRIDTNRKRVRLDPGSAYQKAYDKVQEVVGKQMADAPDPAPMGDLIHRIITGKNVKLQYKIGSFTEKISPLIKHVLPSRLFEKILLSFYKLD